MTNRNQPLRAAKAFLRQAIRGAVESVDLAARHEQSAAICDRLMSLPEWPGATEVVAYSAMGDEVDLAPLLANALSTGRRIYLPRIVGTEIRFFHFTGNPAELSAHDYGMLEPMPDAPEWSPPSHRRPGSGASGDHGAAESSGATAPGSLTPAALIICPGRAFDPAGRRLGRGKGYYDRFLAAVRPGDGGPGSHGAPGAGLPRSLVIGVCFSFQLVDEVPAGPGDQRVDMVVTDTKLFRRLCT